MGFFNRKKKGRDGYRPPPPPSLELVEAVREVEITAETQLEVARTREPQIEKQAEHSERIRRDNALGPRFWQAVGERRQT